jgi:hypothetical protein
MRKIMFQNITLILSVFCMFILIASIMSLNISHSFQKKISKTLAQRTPIEDTFRDGILHQNNLGKQTNEKQIEQKISSSISDDSMVYSLITQNNLDNKVKTKQVTTEIPSPQKSPYDNLKVNITESNITDYRFKIFLTDGGQVSANVNIKPGVTYTPTAQDIEFANTTGGKEILNFKRQAGVYNGIFKAQLSYFIPYNKLPHDVVSALISKEQTATAVNPSSFAEGQMSAPTIVPVVNLKAILGIVVTLSLDVINNFLDSHSQIATTTDYVKRIEKLAALKKCIENPILPYADPSDKVKLQEVFDETVSWVKFDAIASFVYSVGQGTALPVSLSILLNPFFDAEAAVFDEDADNEIAILSKAVTCKKEQTPTQWKGEFNVLKEPNLNLPRDWMVNFNDITKRMTGSFSFKILLDDCQNNECKIEGTGIVRSEFHIPETQRAASVAGADNKMAPSKQQQDCNRPPDQSSNLKIKIFGTYIPSSNKINLRMHANIINAPPIPVLEINCVNTDTHQETKHEVQSDIYEFWYGDDGTILGDDNQTKIYQLSAINGSNLNEDIKLRDPHFKGHYKITIFKDENQ